MGCTYIAMTFEAGASYLSLRDAVSPYNAKSIMLNPFQPAFQCLKGKHRWKHIPFPVEKRKKKSK